MAGETGRQNEGPSELSVKTGLDMALSSDSVCPSATVPGEEKVSAALRGAAVFISV